MHCSKEATQHSSSPNLIRKVLDWQDWTYTDGSLKNTRKGKTQDQVCTTLAGDVLQSIAKTIHQSPSPIHFHKVKSHAGITGNEYADALARNKIDHNLL